MCVHTLGKKDREQPSVRFSWPVSLKDFYLFLSPQCSGIIRVKNYVWFLQRVIERQGSLCIPGWNGTHCKEQAGLELVDICQPLLLENWDKMPESQNLVKSSF